MNSSTFDRGGLLLSAATFCAALGFVSAVRSQETTTILNQADANFGNPFDSSVPLEPVESNEVPAAAILGQATLELIKTGDRAAAEPGETVIYRLLVTNSGTAAVNSVRLLDRLPLGMQLLDDSVQAEFTTESGVSSEATLSPLTREGSTVTFEYPDRLEPGDSLTIAYAVLLTPDAIRGSGRNLASAIGRSPTQDITSSTASHLLKIRQGILSDCGSLIGRVFVDKNFDGEQQPGEPGVPNAVIFMDDGNRITTDPDGLFSLSCLLPGQRTGTLDLSSLPGYSLAPNEYRIQDNSQSRLVQISPGGMERINFAVTPTFREVAPAEGTEN